jgi:hypothetical protein
MNRLHVTAVALLLAGAAVLGAVAVTRTTGLGAAGRHTNDAAVAARTKQLAAFEAKLRAALAAKTPALPPIPKPVAQPVTPTPPPAAPRVVYRQAAPIVVTVHRQHGEDGGREAEAGDEGGGDD